MNTEIVTNNSKEEGKKGRYAVSLLPKDMRAQAYNMECMVDHETGEFLVKDSGGRTLSFNKFSRLTSHIDKVSYACKAASIINTIYEIEAYEKMPLQIEPNKNVLDGIISFGRYDVITRLILSVDIDSIDVTSNADAKALNEDTILITLELACGSKTERFIMTKAALSSKIFNISRIFKGSQPGDIVSCKSIKVDSTSLNNEDVKYILCSILTSFA